MGAAAHIFFLVMGGLVVITIFHHEKKNFNLGKTNRYLKVRKSICSERDFIKRLKVSIFVSFVIRVFILGLFSCAFYAYAHSVNGGVKSLGNLARLSGLEYMAMWVTFSMVAMIDRAINAIWGG